jgi:cyclopropane-fatty-acyl-phospholipid synthase
LNAVTLSSSSYPSRDTARKARPNLARRVLDRAVPALQAGLLHIVLPNGETVTRHGAVAGPEASIVLRRWRGALRILLDGEDGVARGYIDGDWSTPDLAQLLALGMHNEAAMAPQAKWRLPAFIGTRIRHVLRANTRRGSRRNIAAHYDLGNDFFAPWLDAGMNYSSALYGGDEALEQAQSRKLDRIAELLSLDGGERILEIGCGWGALAERLIGAHGAAVCGITLSTEQLAHARARLAGAIANGRADLRLLDYRDVTGRFDRIASIEMIEAVGESYWAAYFTKLRGCLAAGGAALIQAITIDESRFAAYRGHPDFIQRYIFPGGMLPTRAIIEREAERAGLRLVHHESFGDSYVRTLREWRGRFLRAWPKLEALGFDQRFRRMWEYYLVYCETGFRFRAIDVGFFKLAG